MIDQDAMMVDLVDWTIIHQRRGVHWAIDAAAAATHILVFFMKDEGEM